MHIQPRGAVLALAVAVAGLALPATAARAATAGAPCDTNVWKASYYANTTFSGAPKKTACDKTINEAYGTGDPAGVSLPKDNFGVRWTVTRDFGSGGPFSFAAATQDGIRVYLDGKRKINLWKDVTTTQKKTVNVTVPKGKHTIRVDYAAFKGKANVTFGYAPRTSPSVDKTAPLKPTGIKAAFSTSTVKTKVTWSRNVEMDLAGYRVYRKAENDSGWTRISGTNAVTTASYTDTPPPSAERYVYSVAAVDKAGNRSAIPADSTSEKMWITWADEKVPAAPKGVEDNWSLDPVTKVSLSWDDNAEKDLAGYHVYRSTTAPVALTRTNLRATLSSSGYGETLSATGDWYYYVVTAVDKAGLESVASGTASFETRDKIPPVETALNARAAEGESGVTLTWDEPQQSSDDFVGYEVYRSVEPRAAGDVRELVAENVKGTSATDPAPEPGSTYYYWVVAADDAGNVGTPSADVAVRVVGNTTAPGATTGLTATAKDNGVALSWDASHAQGFDHYLLFRGTLVDGAWTYSALLHPAYQEPWQITDTQHLDLAAADGEHVRYSVVAADQYGNHLTPGDGAAVAELTELDLSPTVPAATGGPVFDLSADQYGWLGWNLDLTYEKNANGSEVTGFNVYRWNRHTSTFDKLTSTPEPRDNSVNWWWLDRTMPGASTSYYRVTAVYGDGTESGADEVAAVSY